MTNPSQRERTMLRKKGTPYVRRAIQVICFFWLPALFIEIFNSIKAILMLILHQQGTLTSVTPNIILLAVVTIVTAVAGRFFCGWMCAFGSLEDFLYRLPRLRSRNPRRYLGSADSVLKWVKYILLGIILVFVWGLQLITIPTGSNPWDLFGMLVSFGNWPSVSELAQGWIPAAVLLLLIMGASVVVERFFCRYLCPLGAYFSIVSKLRPLAIAKQRKSCGDCTLCTRRCSMGIPLTELDRVKTGECINCMECVKVCPQGNAHMDLSDRDKNILVAGVVSCALITGGYYLGNFSGTQLSGSTGNAYAVTEATATGIAADLPDGTYTGSGTGYRGETTVAVTVSDGTVTDISITATGDNQEYIQKASSGVIAEILKQQSTDVDAVSGATYSSNGIMEAVKNALSGDSETNTAASSEASTSESTSTDTTQDTAGSTSSSASTAAAESDSSTDSSASTTLKDGTYQGSGTGLRGETDVTVTVSGGKITAVTIDSYQDDQQFFEKAAATMVKEILANQSADVDAVSGATYSSNSIKEAVADALGLDYTPSTIQNEGHNPSGGPGGQNR